MASLKEIKNRIASVRSTLKITSSMKMVASAKLHRAQQAIEGMRPYEQQLGEILAELQSSAGRLSAALPHPDTQSGRVAVVAFSSNSSLCGGFNSNIIKATTAKVDALKAEGKQVDIFTVGRKMTEAMNRLGYGVACDCAELAAHGGYESSAALAGQLMEAYASGKYEAVYLSYNHFVSTASQVPSFECYLPLEAAQIESEAQPAGEDKYILEPSAEELLQELLPKVLRLKIYTAYLDSSAAEHAARTVAMQTASDNAEGILGDLTLEYNKSRQQKITGEILDLVGGSML